VLIHSKPRKSSRHFLRFACFVALAAAVVSATPQPAFANAKYAGIVVDAKTGKTLYASNADAPRYPASLTKMMTLYVLFEEMERGRFNRKSRLKVSRKAAAQPPTKIGLRAGQTIRVDTAIRALAVRSANDVAVVVAENVSGSVAAFASRMTRTARSIGMKNTTFRNPSGLPDSRQKTTARDMALLGRALQDRFPKKYSYFSTRHLSYGKKKYRNTNRLLGAVRGVDGIKTGYTRASGFNLVTSINRDGRKIVAVVMGGKTGKSRNAQMKSLISRYLRKAKRGKRTAPLLVARASSRIPPLPKNRPQNGATDIAAPGLITNALGAPAMVSGSKPSPLATGLTDPIGEQIASAAGVTELGYARSESAERARLATLVEVSAARQANNVAASQSGDRTRSEKMADVKDETPLPGGWRIQIGATPSEKAARRLLTDARSRAADILGSADPFTEPVKKDGTVLFRARFAGFAGKQEARTVCANLKRRSFSCLAVPN
jgi:D-alanyl-D-alanine carboxypeptidase